MSIPSSSAQAPMAATDSAARTQISRAAASPKCSQSRCERCQKPFRKPALRPLGPAPHVDASSTTTRASGSASATAQAVQRPA